MSVLSFLIVLSLILGSSYEKNLYNSIPRSLRCFFMDTDGPCKFLGGKQVSQRILDLYSDLEPKVKEALSTGNFSSLTEDQFPSSPVLLLLIPSRKLSSFGGNKLAMLVTKWKQIPALVKHLVKSVTYDSQPFEFLLELGDNRCLPNEIVDIIGEELLVWNNGFIGILQTAFNLESSLLAHLPLGFLARTLEREPNKMFFYISHWIQHSNFEWGKQSAAIQRLWAYSITKIHPLSEWKYTDFMKMGNLLIGCTPKELKFINRTLVEKKNILLKFDFTTLQVRSIFKEFYEGRNLTQTDFNNLKPFLLMLTPDQLSCFPFNEVNYKVVDFSSPKYLPAVIQVLEYLTLGSLKPEHQDSKSNKVVDALQYGKFIYAVSPSSLGMYEKLPPLLSDLLELQSDLITPFQAFLLTGASSRIDLNDPDLLKCRVLLSALPTCDLVMKNSSSVFYHLLEYMPLGFRPRTVTLLEIFSYRIDNPELLKLILDNPEGSELFKLYPVPYLKLYSDNFINTISELPQKYLQRIKQLPSDVLSSLLTKFKGKNWTWASLNRSMIPTDLLLSSMTCEDVNNLESSDFLVIVSSYNKELTLARKVFPKNLQHCCAQKLLDYLRLKASVSQRFEHEPLTALLSEADITAIGGYILCHLPLHHIKSSQHFSQIIRTVGRLRLDELLVSTSIAKLKYMVQHYVNGKKLNSSMLFDLGNLTTILPETIIRKIDPSGFKLLLESQHIDRRICGGRSEREAWRSLIVHAFGEPASWHGDALIALGDMLIALPFEHLNAVNESALIEVADLLFTKYDDEIEWHEPASFYEVCTSLLKEDERHHYMLSLRGYLRWYINGVQTQLGTVTPFSLLLKNQNESNNAFEVIFNKDDDIIKINDPQYQIVESNTEAVFNAYDSNVTALYSYSSDSDAISTMSASTIGQTFSSTESTSYRTEQSTEVSTVKILKIESNNTTDNLIQHVTEIYTTPSSRLDILFLNLTDLAELDDPVQITNSSLQSTVVAKDNFTFPAMPASKFNITPATSDLISAQTTPDSQSERGFSQMFPATTAVSLITSEIDFLNKSVESEKNTNDLIASSDNLIADVKPPPKSTEPAPTEASHIVKILVPSVTPTTLSVDLIKIDKPDSYKMKPAVIYKRDLSLLSEEKIKVSCIGVKMVGKIVGLSLSLDDIKQMATHELIDCLEIFGEMDLDTDIVKEIWNRIPRMWIPFMGKLVRAATISDIKYINFNISQPWGLEAIAVFGKFNADEEILEHISNKVISSNSGAFLTPGTLVAMGSIICFLPNNRIPMLVSPSAFVKASAALGSSLPCETHCLSQLINLATHSESFGNLKNWTPEDVKQLGITIAGLSHSQWRDLTSLNKAALAGLQSRAAKCLPVEYWLNTPAESLHFLPALTAESLLENEMMMLLTPNRRKIMHSKLSFSNNETESHLPSSGKNLSPTCVSFLILIIMCRIVQ